MVTEEEYWQQFKDKKRTPEDKVFLYWIWEETPMEYQPNGKMAWPIPAYIQDCGIKDKTWW